MIKLLKFIGIWLLSIPAVILYPLLMCLGYSMELRFYRKDQ